MIRPTHIAGLLTASALALVCGCSSKNPDVRQVKPPPVQQSSAVVPSAQPSATPTMAQFNGSIGGAQLQIDATLASLAELCDPAQPDLRGAYDKYCDSLSRLQHHAMSMKTEADAMRASRDAYFSNWEEKKSELDNPTIRASAEDRRKRLQASHDQIVTASNDAKDAYEPFMKNLQDIKKYLAPDLNKSAVADLREAVKKVQADGAVVKQKLGVLAHTLETVQGTGA